MPVIVINGGCAREKAKWLWPAGVHVLLLTGGRDRICNEFRDVQVSRMFNGGDVALPTCAFIRREVTRHT